MNQEVLEQSALSQPVRSLQYMLRELSREYEFLPELAVDGTFGEETLEAVMLFQRELYPPVTGVVDRGTWNAIRARWEEAELDNAPPRGTRLFPGEGCRVEPGSRREFMIVPQVMFRVLARHLNGIAPGVADGGHGPASVENVRWLQRAAGQKESGVLDQRAWDMLSRLYEVFVVRELREAQERFEGGWG